MKNKVAKVIQLPYSGKETATGSDKDVQDSTLPHISVKDKLANEVDFFEIYPIDNTTVSVSASGSGGSTWTTIAGSDTLEDTFYGASDKNVELDESAKSEDQMDPGYEKFLDTKFEHIDYVLTEYKEGLKELKDSFKEVKEDNKKLRGTVIITAISVGLGITAVLGAMVFTMSQINTSWLNTLVQLFQSKP